VEKAVYDYHGWILFEVWVYTAVNEFVQFTFVLSSHARINFELRYIMSFELRYITSPVVV
jgi:hypothetical protein